MDIAKSSPESLVDDQRLLDWLTVLINRQSSRSDQLFHVRTLTASARIYHVQPDHSQVIQQWKKVESCTVSYSAFHDKVLTFAFSELSTRYAYMRVAGTPASIPYYQQYAQVDSDNMAEANSLLRKRRIITGSHWL